MQNLSNYNKKNLATTLASVERGPQPENDIRCHETKPMAGVFLVTPLRRSADPSRPKELRRTTVVVPSEPDD